jgi:hypothetical protein
VRRVIRAISNSLTYLWLASLAVLRPEEVADTHEAAGVPPENKGLKCEDDVQPIANRVPLQVRVCNLKKREKPYMPFLARPFLGILASFLALFLEFQPYD